jgi:hypothetical protein
VRDKSKKDEVWGMQDAWSDDKFIQSFGLKNLRPRLRWKENIKMNLKDVGLKSVALNRAP